MFPSATDIHHRPDCMLKSKKENKAVPAKASVVSWNFSKCFSFSLEEENDKKKNDVRFC